MVFTGLSAVSAVPTGHCSLHQSLMSSPLWTTISQWSLQFPPVSTSLCSFHQSPLVSAVSSSVWSLHSLQWCLQFPVSVVYTSLQWCLQLASSPGHSQTLSRSRVEKSSFLKIKSGSGLGTRLVCSSTTLVSIVYTSLQWCLQFQPVCSFNQSAVASRPQRIMLKTSCIMLCRNS